MEDSLRGKVAPVTGAGRRGGIGTAICRALADRGAHVMLTYWKGYDREFHRDPDEDRAGGLIRVANARYFLSLGPKRGNL